MDLDKVATHPLQTSAWAQFREAWGNEVIETKYGVVIVNKLPLGLGIGTFIRGPEPNKKMLDDLKEIALKNKIIFVKLEPNVIKSEKLIELMRQSGAVKGKTLFTPTTYLIELTKSEEDLLASFKSKTRYNIRYAEKQGVEVMEDNSEKAFDKYIELTRETTKRQGFYAHSEKYHRLMWKYLKSKNIAHLLVAKYKGEILTTWIVFKWRDTLYYPYGASSGKLQNLQTNSAMMWGAIKFGKKHKLKYFDLWGREPGKGFSKFKEGFSPEVKEFLGTWDLVINKKMYTLYIIAEKFRWLILRSKSRFTTPKF